MGVRLDTLTAKVHTELNYQEPKATAGHFYFSRTPELSAEGAAQVKRLQDRASLHKPCCSACKSAENTHSKLHFKLYLSHRFEQRGWKHT